MVVIITKYIKKKTKNFLKRWFVEPKANVFVGDIDDNRLDVIIKYIEDNIDDPFGGLIISSTNSVQKYKIVEKGQQKEKNIKKKIMISGIEFLIDSSLKN